jgi:hypothetical protein
LEIDLATGRFSRNESDTLACGLLVVNETSMVDVPLMHSLVRALPTRAGLILVGDVDGWDLTGSNCGSLFMWGNRCIGWLLAHCVATGRFAAWRIKKPGSLRSGGVNPSYKIAIKGD